VSTARLCSPISPSRKIRDRVNEYEKKDEQISVVLVDWRDKVVRALDNVLSIGSSTDSEIGETGRNLVGDKCTVIDGEGGGWSQPPQGSNNTVRMVSIGCLQGFAETGDFVAYDNTKAIMPSLERSGSGHLHLRAIFSPARLPSRRLPCSEFNYLCLGITHGVSAGVPWGPALCPGCLHHYISRDQ
jgi:hypothetical protein